MKHLATVICVAALTGCTASIHYTNNPNYPTSPEDRRITRTYIDPNLPQADTLLAIKEWNQAMNGSYFLLVMKWENDPQPPAVVIRAAHYDSPMIVRGGEGTTAITHPWDGGYPSALIYVDIDFLGRYPFLTVPTIEHEIGHAFGADHMDGTLMQWNLNSSHCIDRKTIEQVSNKLHLDPQYLNHC